MTATAPAPRATRTASWTFLSNHAHVLVFLASSPHARLRDTADAVGITERAVRNIIGDLEAAGAITRFREGRCNRYRIHARTALRHPVERHCSVADMLAMVHGPRRGGRARR